MDEITIRQIRDLFEEDFKENDYCIGQQHVEKMFRKLLNEPEPKPLEVIRDAPSITAKQFSDILSQTLTEDKLKHLFERDSALYEQIKRK